MLAKSLSIYQKILLLVLAIISFLGCVVSLLVWNFMDDLVSQQLRKRASEIAVHVAQRSANLILVEDYYSLYELINQTKRESNDVRYILLIDYDGRLLAHTFAEGIPEGLWPVKDLSLRGVQKLTSDEGVIYDTVVPIEKGEVGFVRVGMTEEYSRNSMTKKIHKLLIVTMMVCCLAALFCWKMTFFIARPLRDLAQVAKRIRAGDFTSRAKIEDSSDLGNLAFAFNEMTAELIAANQEKTSLLGELEAKEALRNRLIQKLLSAQEDERKRISRELHDETSQALTSLMVSMRVLAEEAEDDSQRRALLVSRDITAGILQNLRNLAVELRPPALDELGLSPAMEKYALQFGEHYKLAVSFTVKGLDGHVTGQIALALYRILQEGLTNAAKHSAATKIRIFVEEQASAFYLCLEDDGRGISEQDLAKAKAENRLGLYGMQERAEILGGSFSIETATGGGTRLVVTIPKEIHRGEG
ncbi:MAG: histidine kinase [Sporomusaceae bacterium]|nr:histidine kinase [Sporomusaceae bacterium]